MFQKMYQMISQAKIIYIYRHISSDYDALGSQFGLAKLIKDNFKDVDVICMGEVNEELNQRMQIEVQKPSLEKKQDNLAIVLDTANQERIDGEGYNLCDYVIKVDHHIVVDSYGDINIEDPTASSTSELICRFYEANQDRLALTKQAATYLFYGIIGDTNRFMYESANAKTLHAASLLLLAGIDKQAIYESMYLSNLESLQIKGFILNNFVFDEGVGYYVMDQEDLATLGISRDLGSMFVNTLADIKEIEVWAAITYDSKQRLYRVSLRSRHVPIQPVASKYHGGGHIYASGAKLSSLDELPGLILSLKEAIKNEISI